MTKVVTDFFHNTAVSHIPGTVLAVGHHRVDTDPHHAFLLQFIGSSILLFVQTVLALATVLSLAPSTLGICILSSLLPLSSPPVLPYISLPQHPPRRQSSPIFFFRHFQ